LTFFTESYGLFDSHRLYSTSRPAPMLRSWSVLSVRAKLLKVGEYRKKSVRLSSVKSVTKTFTPDLVQTAESVHLIWLGSIGSMKRKIILQSNKGLQCRGEEDIRGIRLIMWKFRWKRIMENKFRWNQFMPLSRPDSMRRILSLPCKFWHLPWPLTTVHCS